MNTECLWVRDQRTKQSHGIRVSNPQDAACKSDSHIMCVNCLNKYSDHRDDTRH